MKAPISSSSIFQRHFARHAFEHGKKTFLKDSPGTVTVKFCKALLTVFVETLVDVISCNPLLQVRYLKIIEKSGYQALPWVRYITQNGDYQLRTQ